MWQLQLFLKKYSKEKMAQIKTRNHIFPMCKKPLLQVSPGRKMLVACLISELRDLQLLTILNLLCFSSDLDRQEPMPAQELCRHKSNVIKPKWVSCGSRLAQVCFAFIISSKTLLPWGLLSNLSSHLWQQANHQRAIKSVLLGLGYQMTVQTHSL